MGTLGLSLAVIAIVNRFIRLFNFHSVHMLCFYALLFGPEIPCIEERAASLKLCWLHSNGSETGERARYC